MRQTRGLKFAIFVTVAIFLFCTGVALADDAVIMEEMKNIFQALEKKDVPVAATATPQRQTVKPALQSLPPGKAVTVGAQPVVQQPAVAGEPLISVTSYDRKMGDILLEIGASTQYAIIPGPEVDFNKPVVVDLRDVPLSKAINAITAYANYGYEIEGTMVTILKYASKTIPIPDAAMSAPVMTAEMGGDMLGGSGGGGSSSGSGGGDFSSQNLKASVTLKRAPETINQRGVFEENIRSLKSPDGSVIVDWLSASVIVHDSPRNIAKIESYINNLRESSDKQVMVEAIVTAVSTTKGFQYGIDWNMLVKRLGGERLREWSLSTAVSSVATPTITLTRTAADISMVLKALEEQGSLKVLANPRTYARNLQPTLLTSGKSVPFLSSVTRTTSGVSGDSSYSYQISKAQDGMMLPVKCHIRHDGKIDVQLAPILSSIDEMKEFRVGSDSFTNPVSSVQQTMQSVTVNDGETIIIGGIKKERNERQDKSVPILGKIPFVGWLFNSENSTSDVAEVVIALKVTRVQ